MSNQPFAFTVMVNVLPDVVKGISAGVESPRQYPIRGFTIPQTVPDKYITMYRQAGIPVPDAVHTGLVDVSFHPPVIDVAVTLANVMPPVV